MRQLHRVSRKGWMASKGCQGLSKFTKVVERYAVASRQGIDQALSPSLLRQSYGKLVQLTCLVPLAPIPEAVTVS